MKAYAAYRADTGWIPTSSVLDTPEAVEDWINKTYVSGSARRQFKVVPVTKTKDGEIRRRRVHG